jgi:hypothetical protein
VASGFNTSIVFMIVSVFTLLGFVIFAIVRAVRQMEAQAVAAEGG